MTTPHSKPRRLGLLAVAALLLAALAAWFFWPGAERGAPGGGGAAGGSGAAGARPAQGPQLFHKPLWKDLSAAQQLALQPLKNEWDVMEGTRKRKWLEMSRRFGSMNRSEQDRVHERMRQWVRLTPEQRALARENYTRTRKLAPGEKTATWESYKQLTADQKRRLAQDGARKTPAPAASPIIASPIIAAPTSCPPGTTRRGASCMSLQAPASIPAAPAITQPAPPPMAPGAGAPAAGAPAAPPSTPPIASPAASNANG